MNRDRSPIDQQWVRGYCDRLTKVVEVMPDGPYKDAVLHRVECVMDLLEAWQKREWTAGERR